MTLQKRNACYKGWSEGVDEAIQNYKNSPSEESWIIVEVIAAVLAELDRTHRRKTTQKIQSFVWEHAFLRGETCYERYFKSGYFKEEYAR